MRYSVIKRQENGTDATYNSPAILQQLFDVLNIYPFSNSVLQGSVLL